MSKQAAKTAKRSEGVEWYVTVKHIVNYTDKACWKLYVKLCLGFVNMYVQQKMNLKVSSSVFYMKCYNNIFTRILLVLWKQENN